MRKRDKRHLARPFPYVTLADALRRTVKSPKIRRQLRAIELSRDWDSVVGPSLAEHVRPLSLDKSVLTIKADSSVWRQQISLLKPQILAKFTEKFSQHNIKELRIR